MVTSSKASGYASYNVHIFFISSLLIYIFYGLFTWREGAPDNRATLLEGLKYSPHFTCNPPNRDSEWAAWVISWAAAKHNKSNGRPRKLFSISFQLPARARACSLPETRLLHWSLQIDCHSVRQITLANGNYESIHFAPPCFRGLSHLGQPRLRGSFTLQKATPPSRVLRASRHGAPGRRATLSSM